MSLKEITALEVGDGNTKKKAHTGLIVFQHPDTHFKGFLFITHFITALVPLLAQGLFNSQEFVIPHSQRGIVVDKPLLLIRVDRKEFPVGHITALKQYPRHHGDVADDRLLRLKD